MTFLLALLGGIGGAVAGALIAAAVASSLAPLLGISSFEGQAGYFAVGIGLLGGFVGLIAGILIMLWRRGTRSVTAFAGRFVIVILILAGLVVAGLGFFWFNRDLVNTDGPAPQLAFEIRLPAGAASPPAKDVTIHLDSVKGHRPADVFADKFRRDGDRPVIVGSVEIYYRESSRLLVLRLPNQPDQIFSLMLGRDPKHSKELGAWQRVDFVADQGQDAPRRSSDKDQYEVRYRAVWAGED